MRLNYIDFDKTELPRHLAKEKYNAQLVLRRMPNPLEIDRHASLVTAPITITLLRPH
jgi:hypothetical protein